MIFVFGKRSGYENIQCLYSVKFRFTNIFVSIFVQKIDIRITLSLFN